MPYVSSEEQAEGGATATSESNNDVKKMLMKVMGCVTCSFLLLLACNVILILRVETIKTMVDLPAPPLPGIMPAKDGKIHLILSLNDELGYKRDT